MATRLENLQRIRALLDFPQPSRPNFTQVFQLELSCECDILNSTNNSGKPWAINTTQLNYAPGLDSYQINATDFGKPVLVTRLLTNNPYITKVTVPFQDFNHQMYGTVWQMWDNFYGWAWNADQTPERMTFLRQGVVDAQMVVTLEPQLQMSAVYEISYIPSRPDDSASLESVVQLPEMAELIQYRTAMMCLPYAAWYEDEGANQVKRKELAMAFEYPLSIKEPIFQRYISSIVRAKDVTISSWCDSW